MPSVTLGGHVCECCAWNPDPWELEKRTSRPGRCSCHTIPRCPATVAGDEFLPVCEVPDLSPKELWASVHLRGNKANASIWTTTRTTKTSPRTTDAWPNSKTYPYELIHLGMFVSINLQFLPRAKLIDLLFSTSVVTARKSVRFQTVKRCRLMTKSIRCPRNLQSPNNQEMEETVTSIKCYTNGPVLVAAPCTMWTVLFYVHRCN